MASDRPRRECLVDAGRTSLRLFGGVVPLLIIAGLIEGFVSPTGLDPLAKFAIGGVDVRAAGGVSRPRRP